MIQVGFVSGDATVTVALWRTVPYALVAVITYVVVSVGCTGTPVAPGTPVTTPTPRSIAIVSNVETSHVSIVVSPALIFAGTATTLFTVGTSCVTIVTFAVDVPSALDAVIV